MSSFTIMWILGALFLIAILVWNFGRSSAYGSLRRRDWLCEDYTGYPHSAEVYQVITGPEGNPIHEGVENGYVIYERRGLFGRGKPRPHHFDKDNFEIVPAPINKHVSHPVYSKPRIRIGVKSYEKVKGGIYGNLRTEYLNMYDKLAQLKQYNSELVNFRDEIAEKERKNAKEWKEATQPMIAPNKQSGVKR